MFLWIGFYQYVFVWKYSVTNIYYLFFLIYLFRHLISFNKYIEKQLKLFTIWFFLFCVLKFLVSWSFLLYFFLFQFLYWTLILKCSHCWMKLWMICIEKNQINSKWDQDCCCEENWSRSHHIKFLWRMLQNKNIFSEALHRNLWKIYENTKNQCLAPLALLFSRKCFIKKVHYSDEWSFMHALWTFSI